MSNLQDLPPAQRLACLIEAGVAANPDLKQGQHRPLNLGQAEACAYGFAALGAGCSRELVSYMQTACAMEAAGVSTDGPWCNRVWLMNDRGVSLPEIIASLREGELSKVCA